MSKNMTICPECGEAFDTVAQEKELPLQALRQECPGCGYTVEVSIINFPDNSFTVVAPALKGDECEVGSLGTHCDCDAMIRLQHSDSPIEGRCADHMGLYREAALDLRSEL